ncbi:MAG: hypothetical protein OXG47_08630 [bacterium]|nr:hypothetical protein [bacterium]MCY3926407.1 hypothetical protein [bacterium]
MTLEWLLIIGAMGVVASLSVLVVERTIDDEIEVPEDPAVRLISADIDAAFVAADAVRTAIRLAGTPSPDDDYAPATDIDFALRCQRVVEAYSDVLEPVPDPLPSPLPASPASHYPLPDQHPGHPWVWDWDWDAAATNPLENAPEGPAKCVLVPRALSS